MIFQGIIGIAAIIIGMLLGYAYHFFMVRLLPAGVYGDLSLVIGILSIIMVPTGSMQIIFTREVAKLGSDSDILMFLRSYAKKIILYGILAAAAFIPASYIISKALGDPGIVRPLEIISAAIPAAYLFSITKSYFQGKEKIMFLSGLIIAEPAIKVVSAILLVNAGFGLLGASLSLVGAAFIFLVLGIIVLKPFKKFSGIAHTPAPSMPLSYVLATNIMLMIFLYMDLFAVKYYLGSEKAGFYNVANITAKAIMYAVGGVTIVLLPKTSKLNMRADKAKIRSLVLKAAALISPVFTAFLLFPEEIISLFYTEKYLPALMPFRILSVGMFAYALFMILLNLSWSQNKEKMPLVLSSVILAMDVMLLAYLVPAYGLTGASIATTISSVVLLAALAGIITRDFRQ